MLPLLLLACRGHSQRLAAAHDGERLALLLGKVALVHQAGDDVTCGTPWPTQCACECEPAGEQERAGSCGERPTAAILLGSG